MESKVSLESQLMVSNPKIRGNIAAVKGRARECVLKLKEEALLLNVLKSWVCPEMIAYAEVKEVKLIFHRKANDLPF